MTCAPSEDSDHPGHLPSLIRVFAVRLKKGWSLATHKAHSELWSDWADAQANLSLHWDLPSLIRVFAVRLKKGWSLATHKAHSELWSDWADAQANLSLHWDLPRLIRVFAGRICHQHIKIVMPPTHLLVHDLLQLFIALFTASSLQ